MAATEQIAPVYENKHTVLDEQGNVVLASDSTVYEILQRLNSYVGEYIFDDSYGSELSNLFNTKNTGLANNATVDLWVRQALSPMVIEGKIRSNIRTISYLTTQSIRVTVYAINNKDKPITATFRSFLISS